MVITFRTAVPLQWKGDHGLSPILNIHFSVSIERTCTCSTDTQEMTWKNAFTLIPVTKMNSCHCAQQCDLNELLASFFNMRMYDTGQLPGASACLGKARSSPPSSKVPREHVSCHKFC